MNVNSYIHALRKEPFVRQAGRITAIHGLVLEARGCSVRYGEIVDIFQPGREDNIRAEVVGLKEEKILLMPFASVEGLSLDSMVIPLGRDLIIPVSEELLGRVINPLGETLDGKGDLHASDQVLTYGKPINPLDREPIQEKIHTGVKAIDVLTPVGNGQRIGIFAGSGVGKSTLLGMISKYSDIDVTVIALVGERGREVGDFIRDNLGEQGLQKSVIVVATAGEPAVMRRQAAYSSTAIAEWFRKKGKRVLLIMDSVTRFAMAQREIGVSVGESVGARGYPSSVFAALPPLIERCGNLRSEGSITAVYTVLVEGDDMNEPISDHMRSILDGHIMLSRELASRGHYPAIDILNSLSRLDNTLLTNKEKEIALCIRDLMASYSESKDLIELGLYKKGSNVNIDLAIQLKDDIDTLLQQRNGEASSNEQSWRLAKQIKDDVT